MADTSPPKRMTRSRAAAARATTSVKSTQPSQSNRVTKSTKPAKSTPAATAASVKAAAKPAASQSAAKSTAKSTTAKSTAKSTAKPVTATSAAGVAGAASTDVRPVTAAKSTAATKSSAAKSAAATTSARLAMKKRKVRYFDSDDDEDDLSKEDNTQYTMNRPAKKLRGPTKAVGPQPKPEPRSATQPQEKETQSTPPTISSPNTSATAMITSPSSAPATTTSPPPTTTVGSPTRTTRGRAKRSAATVAAAALKKQTPAAISHSRTRKATTKSGNASTITAAEKSDKKTTRARPGKGTITTTYDTEPTPGLKSAVSRPTSKIDGGLKKTVTFEEPEKENLLPKAATTVAGSAAKPTGMRAKPVRKPVVSGRVTRSSARAATADTTEKKPLSPKKDGPNRPLSRDASSDDELATFEKTPLKSSSESPLRPADSVTKAVAPTEEKQDESSPQTLMSASTSIFSSPARRPPLSPYKDAMKSPAKRVEGASPLLFPTPSAEVKGAQSPFKSAYLQSPAKRPQMPLYAFNQSTQEQSSAPGSPTKITLLSTPAKRPASSIALFGSPARQAEEKLQETPEETVPSPTEELNEEQLQYQIRSDIGLLSPSELAVAEKSAEPMIDVGDEDNITFESPLPQHASPGRLSAAEDPVETMMEVDDKDNFGVGISTPQLPFPGRLSAVLPRHADPTFSPQKSENVEMGELVDNELNVEAPHGDYMDLGEAATEEPSTGACVEDSLEESMNAYEDETTEEYVDAREGDSTIQPVDVHMDEATEQSEEVCAAEANKQPLGASMAEFDSQPMDTCVPDSVDNESKTETEAVRAAESEDQTPDASISETNDQHIDVSLSDSVDNESKTETEEARAAESEDKTPDVSTAESNSQQVDVCVSDSMDEPESKAEKQEEVCATEPETQALDATMADTNGQQVDVGHPDLKDNYEPQVEEPAVPNTQATPAGPTPEQSDPDKQGHRMPDSEDKLAAQNEPIAKDQGDTMACDPVPSTSARPLFKSTERKIPASALRAASRAIKSLNRPTYTAQSMKLGTWKAASPAKSGQGQQAPSETDRDEFAEEYPLLIEKYPQLAYKPVLFNDNYAAEFKMALGGDMRGSTDETQAAMEALIEADIDAKFAKINFDLTEEDLLQDIKDIEEALEANMEDNMEDTMEDNMEEDEKSLPSAPEATHTRLSSIPEVNEEQETENTVPIDPALIGTNAESQPGNLGPVTPLQPYVPRAFHTVSQVPLKPGDDSIPYDMKRHCSTVSKAPLQRPNGALDPNGAPVTPLKSVGTPARMTRPDLTSGLLRGAIVFVDVHTAEGTDAGRIFVDLLLQMGARCVKAWPWNPANSTEADLNAATVGITHVVFKDGSKRTLEKINGSRGLVHCVGVSWVLDCEKENQWLNEKDYRVDTSLIPRGGHNRSNSMEPKAIVNMNGSLITPVKANLGCPHEPQTVPNNHMSRRDSSLWMRTPSEHDEDEDAPSEMDWEPTPVPQTPAPEMVARFARDISPGTPSTVAADSSPNNNQHLMQTCPPKRSGLFALDQSSADSGQEPSFMMRVMAARRRSMQFAPKVASPLKKQWKHSD